MATVKPLEIENIQFKTKKKNCTAFNWKYILEEKKKSNLIALSAYTQQKIVSRLNHASYDESPQLFFLFK